MGRVEGFASKRSIPEAAADALGMGLGFTWVLTGISLVREILGSGSVFGIPILPESLQILFFVMPAGGFFVFALFISLNILIKSRLKPLEKGEEE
jgi:electron transport complex protein RnfE